MSLPEAEAKLKLSLMNSNVLDLDRIDTVAQLTIMGLPQEIITRLNELWDTTKEIGGQVVHIGKVIIAEIMRFVNENSGLAVGVAIGAAVGALTSIIPAIGPLLAPIATAISMLIGGIAGYRLDEGAENESGVIAVSQDVIMIARKFFELIGNILGALKGEFS